MPFPGGLRPNDGPFARVHGEPSSGPPRTDLSREAAHGAELPHHGTVHVSHDRAEHHHHGPGARRPVGPDDHHPGLHGDPLRRHLLRRAPAAVLRGPQPPQVDQVPLESNVHCDHRPLPAVGGGLRPPVPLGLQLQARRRGQDPPPQPVVPPGGAPLPPAQRRIQAEGAEAPGDVRPEHVHPRHVPVHHHPRGHLPLRRRGPDALPPPLHGGPRHPSDALRQAELRLRDPVRRRHQR
mmetsp:Transcript_152751/g.266811  ORF Transcript_152751/g.266811 Transcript_152751/m.266811 type:complete len:237 (+) Transcript_152751:1628-2338(+)